MLTVTPAIESTTEVEHGQLGFCAAWGFHRLGESDSRNAVADARPLIDWEEEVRAWRFAEAQIDWLVQIGWEQTAFCRCGEPRPCFEICP